MIHASDGRYAIRSIGPYFIVQDRRISTKHISVGTDESFEIIDVNYPPPPRPVKIESAALIQEAAVYQKEVLCNGIDSSLQLRLKTPLNGSSMTIALWIYYESYKRDWNQSFWLSQIAEDQETISLYTTWGRLAWRCNGADVAVSRGEFQFRKWHHVAIVVEGMRNILYVDGFPQRNGSSRVTPSLSAPLWFGRSAKGEPESFCNGMMKDILILNRALSPKEVRGIAVE
ncbi:LamG domain-containing protein [bacterium]|nr:LamG domain-containing protein [bacterium]MCI0606622.1 LamG domain-containing protein [bacterium]